ncbi:hypothetical protein LJ655_02640 [Paraburkholderia sp. MMS20-SJTN17]|uniref:Uncharacterized protein n=1 Tax=Paraburkholderia translucens TaxID=2886945 RepID=A0ABS8K7T9_9BURK|nr:hypothetical protein [Paraburkholderia sp. MMS20-SJTN17]MCC8400803.1 hypothetical protein [Paraburkholderia sp. MMS20-SJTN17]
MFLLPVVVSELLEAHTACARFNAGFYKRSSDLRDSFMYRDEVFCAAPTLPYVLAPVLAGKTHAAGYSISMRHARYSWFRRRVQRGCRGAARHFRPLNQGIFFV